MTTHEPIQRSLSPIDEGKRFEFESTGDESDSGSSVVAQSYAISSASHIVDTFTTSSPSPLGEFDLAAATSAYHGRGASGHPPSTEPNGTGHNGDTEKYANDRTTSGATSAMHSHSHSTESRSSSTGSMVKDELWALHADELVSLAQRQGPVVKPSDSYALLAWKIVKQYLHYLVNTWLRCLWSLLVLPSTSLDRMSMVAFAFFSSGILFIIMIWCLIGNMPYVVKLFDKWSKKHAGGLTMTNASYPSIFQHTPSNEASITAAREALARPMPPRDQVHDQESPRVFNLDIAKLLFQCSALMYERTSSPLLDVLETTRGHFDPKGVTGPALDTPKPGQALEGVIGLDQAKLVSDCLHVKNNEENEMTRFAARLGMKYATVSELNTQTSACSGLFWDPKSTYIILAFKGTEPTEFCEWAADFTYEPRDAGDWIRGFGKVHGGFIERVFPRRPAPGSRVPYYTIRDAVRHTAASLLKKHPEGTKINVWFTGHSLGTAMGSLVYARAIHEPRDFGPNIVIRDAFMFAAPILCDVQSAHAFHNRLYHDERRTMWRITNANDCVATALPDWGDDLRMHLSPYNLFSFSHLGVEITMHPAPRNKVLLSGNAMPYGSPVLIESVGMSKEEDAEREKELLEARKVIARLMRIPIVGRIISHGTAPYWDQLLRIQPGLADWDDS